MADDRISTTAQSTADPADRAARVRAVVETCMRRRAAGQSVENQSLLAAHADLLPELERELKLLDMIERAKSRSRSDTPPGPPTPITFPPDGPTPPGYSLVREIHRGGQGVVYEAVQQATGRRVAVKVRREGLFSDDSDAERFVREVEILGQLDHPGIVRIIDSGVHNGRFFYVMDYVEGVTCDEHVVAEQLGVPAILELVEKIALAVNTAHLRGVIHRDLKPANIMVDTAGHPRVVDFGLARLTTELSGTDLIGIRARTLSGAFIGSLPWASPEQAEGIPGRIDIRTDVYSLGVVLFQLLTGQLPYSFESGSGSNQAGLRSAISVILNASPSRPSQLNGELDSDIDTIVLKCLAKDPDRRYQSAGELAADIRRRLENRPILARPPSVKYQINRFAKRNRGLVVALGAVAMALSLGAFGTVRQLIRTRAAEAEARQQAGAARRQAYIASVYAADAAIRGNDAGAASRYLDRAPPEHRSWEWHYLNRLSDASTGALPTTGPVGMVESTLEGGRVVTVARDGRTELFGDDHAKPMWSTHPMTLDQMETVLTARFSADGSRIALTKLSGAVVIDAADGSIVRRFDWPIRTAVGCLDADGSRLIVAGPDKGVQFFDVASGRELFAVPAHSQYFRAIDIAADDSRLFTVELPDLIVRSLTDGSVLKTIRLASQTYLGRCTARCSPSGDVISVALGDTLLLLRPDDPEPEPTQLRGHTNLIRSTSFDAQGRRLVTASDDQTVRVWDVATGKNLATLLGHRARPMQACFVGDSQIASATPEEPRPRLWDLTHKPDGRPAPLNRGEDSAAFLTDDQLLIVDDRGSLRTRSVQTGETGPPLLSLGGNVEGTIDPAGKFGAYIDGQLRVMLLDIDTRATRQVGIAEPLENALQVMRYRAYSSTLGTYVLWFPAILGRKAHVITTATQSDRAFGLDGDASIVFAALSDDERHLAVAGSDRRIRVWSLNSGEVVSTFTGHEEDVTAARFSPDGKRVASAGRGGWIRIWDLESGRQLAAQQGLFSAANIRFTPDGRRLACIGDGASVRLCDAETAQDVLVLGGFNSFAIWMLVSPDGRYILAGDHNQTSLMWDAGPAAAGSSSTPSDQGR